MKAQARESVSLFLSEKVKNINKGANARFEVSEVTLHFTASMHKRSFCYNYCTPANMFSQSLLETRATSHPAAACERQTYLVRNGCVGTNEARSNAPRLQNIRNLGPKNNNIITLKHFIITLTFLCTFRRIFTGML